jgi:hypothetical protein
MAHHMKMKVTTEGVETQAQVDLMKRLGCDQLQGYLYRQADAGRQGSGRDIHPLPRRQRWLHPPAGSGESGGISGISSRETIPLTAVPYPCTIATKGPATPFATPERRIFRSIVAETTFLGRWLINRLLDEFERKSRLFCNRFCVERIEHAGNRRVPR